MLTRLKAQMFLQTLREAEDLAHSARLQYSAQLLKRLVAHATESVFWQQRLAILRDNNASISFDRWSEVPLLTDADLGSTAKQPATAGPGESDVIDVGTEAGPFRLRDKLALIADQCMFELALEYHGVDLNRPIVDILAQPFLFSEDWAWNTTFEKAPRHEIPAGWPVNMQVQALRRRAGMIVRASPTVLARIVDHLTDHHEPAPWLLAAVSVGAPLDKTVRDRVRKHLAHNVVAIWHDQRFGILAFEDASGSGWRTADATQYVELINAYGHRCRDGESGRVVITPLYGYAAPAIRFVTAYDATASAAETAPRRLVALSVSSPSER
jgi:hypothetical protein